MGEVDYSLENAISGAGNRRPRRRKGDRVAYRPSSGPEVSQGAKRHDLFVPARNRGVETHAF